MSNYKIVILGLTGSGKSTLGQLLHNKFKLNIIEVDEEVKKKNHNIWPKEEEIIDRLFDEINKEIINQNNVVYITSFLDTEWIKNFYSKGFWIIELHANKEVLLDRKKKRGDFNNDTLKRFLKNYELYNRTILNPTLEKYYLLSLDTSKMMPEKILEEVVTSVGLE